MKKFLIFLVAIITTVCIGVTFYQFAKNNEVIKIDAKTVYINYGETLSLTDIGFSRKDASKETTINFNAGGDEVTSIIKYDELTSCYVPTNKGGSTTIKITTSNRKYKSFSIDVVVGIGSEENPYYISTEEQLFNITNEHVNDNSHFKLVNDIELTEKHTPIGFVNNTYSEFNGKFNGDYHTISNLNIGGCDYVGLFSILAANSEVYNLNIDSANIEGAFVNAGAVAGICYGNINKVVVSNPNISNTKITSNTGAVVGLLQTDNLNNITAGILRTSAYTTSGTKITARGNLGGIAGTVDSAVIHACHTNLDLNSVGGSSTGGLVGTLNVNPDTYIRESYSISKIKANLNVGNIIGKIQLAPKTKLDSITKELVLVGLYFDKDLNSLSGVGSDVNKFATASNFAINGKSKSELLTKNTYVYYINSNNDVVYWDKVWYLVNGEYPTLTFVNKFDDVVLEGTQIPTTPDNPSTPDISNPDSPNTSTIVISNKTELLNAFQSSNQVNGNYILNADIDLGGINWIPVRFSGTFKSSGNKNYVISNFKIVGSNLLYAGFFYNLSSSTISNITFSNVQLTSATDMETVGIVVGHIRGNVVIKNVDVVNSEINTNTKYAGGIAGYVGNVVTKIEKCNIQNLAINEKALNVGGICGYSSKETYIISCKVKNSNNLKGVDRVGGIAAVNYGTIYDSSFAGNIQSVYISDYAYFGGLVGINYSDITNSTSYAKIEVANTSSTSGASYFVGGLAGYNMGSLVNCSAYSDQINANNSTNTVYLAGLTGYNTGTIKLCMADILNIGSTNNSIYSAGLSVFNYGGNIFGCYMFGNLTGYSVAGLVRINTNDGLIDSCMVGNKIDNPSDSDKAIFKGVYVAGLVHEISSGEISNCLVSAKLTSTNNNGWTAGFAGFMPYTNGKFGTISHCISNVTFSKDGVGSSYLDIVQDGLMKKARTTGTISQSVILNDYNKDKIVISEYSKFLWKTQKPGSNSNYVIKSLAEMQTIATYLEPNNCNFNIGVSIGNYKWIHVSNSQLPIPSAMIDIFGYDIIGL